MKRLIALLSRHGRFYIALACGVAAAQAAYLLGFAAPLVAGGDDYELLCAVPGDRADAFVREARQAKVAVTAIGGLIAGLSPPSFLDGQGRELALKRLSYSHF